MRWLHRWIEAGCEARRDDPERLRRVRAVHASGLAIASTAAVASGVLAANGRAHAAAFTLAAALLSLGNMLYLRRKGSVDIAGQVAVALPFAILLVGSLEPSLPVALDLSWVALLPVWASLLVGLGAVWFWAGVGAATLVAAWSLALPASTAGRQPLFEDLAIVLAASLITHILDRSRRDTEVRLQAVNSALQRDADHIRLTQEISAIANGATRASDAMQHCLERLCTFMGWPVGHVYLIAANGSLEATPIWHLEDAEHFAPFRAVTEHTVYRPGSGLPGRSAAWQRALWMRDLSADASSMRGAAADAAGLRAGLGLPLVVEGQTVAVLEFYARDRAEPDPITLAMLEHAATQIGRVIERERANGRIRSLAFYDSLTGLPNRQHFHHELERALEQARRKARPLALLFIDIDRFKKVNDSLGHSVGDGLLREVAVRFRNSLRISDRVARAHEDSDPLSRLGGDEFTVLLPEIHHPQDAALVARRMLGALAEAICVDGNEIPASASIGIAIHPGDGADADSLLRSADAAMYSAKEHGRNAFRFFDASMNASGLRRLHVEGLLRRALDHDGLRLHYQPIWDARSRRIVGAEALLRMAIEGEGPVSPEEFIAVAEESELIVELGEWVLRSACRQTREWTAERSAPFRIAVNLSGRHLSRSGAVALVKRALRETGLRPEQLGIEITESTIMQDDELTNSALARLAGMGVGLALDDFGTGYSSLSYLRRFPLDRVKIDRSFVREIPDNADDGALTAAIIAMAHGLRLDVVAEGVETEAQLRFLTERGCDMVQGYLLGRPMPANAFGRLLDKQDA